MPHILLLGASGVVFTDTGPSGSLASLLAAELSRRSPERDWTAAAREIPPARDMPDRVRAAVAAGRPDAVVLAVSASYFTYEYVSARVRRRWPLLYRLARSIGDALRSASGGGFEGSASARGWLFRLPRTAARAVVGAEPYMKVENAIANSRASLAFLVEEARLPVLFKLPTMSRELEPAVAARYEARRQQYNAAIRDTCARYGVLCYDLREVMAAEGKEDERVADGLHSTLATRRWEANFLAGLILDRVPVDAP